MIGKALGPYQVLSKLGEGGMGEVYRATDTKLKRQVAIKVLPDAVATDPQRLARFQREAEVLAALNHPNIAAIYGLEDTPDAKALVMELVEGPTLAELIGSGVGPGAWGAGTGDASEGRKPHAASPTPHAGHPKGLPLSDALAIARQITDALEAAHAQGIIHRDLKPANIKVREDGTVKVLDFGLAKAMEPTGSSSPNLSMSPTITTPAMTEMGMILGTAAYMSPEQAKGRPADKRSDVWAFGAVLYEMLTGRRAFTGDDVSDTMASVLKADTDWDAFPPGVPATIVTVIRRCLQRDITQRIRDIGDVRLALDGAFEVPASGTPAVAAGTSGVPHWLRYAMVGGIAAVLAVGLTQLRGPDAVSVAPQRLSIVTPPDYPIAFGWTPGSSLAISPDGTTVVYVARSLAGAPGDSAETQRSSPLRVRSLNSLDTRGLPGTEDGRQPFFSPDGRWVGFFTRDGDLKKVQLIGGSPLTLVSGINGGAWAFGAWTDVDEIVFSTSDHVIQRVSADGGAAEPITSLDASRNERDHFGPEFIEGTRTVLFSVAHAGTSVFSIEAVGLDTGERRLVLDNAGMPHYLESGHLLFQRDESILIAPFDRDRVAITGPAVPLVDDVRRDGRASEGQRAQLAVSRNGTLAFVPAADALQALVLVGRDGRAEPVGLPADRYTLLSASPDGRYLAFEIDSGADTDVYVRDLTRGATTRVTQPGGADHSPDWRPDGRALAVSSRTPDGSALFLKELGGAERLLLRAEPGTRVRNASWSPDGRQLAYTLQQGSQHDIWVLTVGDPIETRPVLNGPFSEHSPSFSPDGRWLAYTSDESGRREVWVMQYPEGDRFPVSTDGGSAPLWRGDGREIFFVGQHQGEGTVMAVAVTPAGDGLDLGTPTPLFAMRSPGPNGVMAQYASSGNAGRQWGVLPDGRFVMARGADVSATREIVIVQNWFEELRGLLPTE